MSYVVRYHPEGWRSAKDEMPEENGVYIVAGEIISWNGDKRKEIGLDGIRCRDESVGLFIQR